MIKYPAKYIMWTFRKDDWGKYMFPNWEEGNYLTITLKHRFNSKYPIYYNKASDVPKHWVKDDKAKRIIIKQTANEFTLLEYE